MSKQVEGTGKTYEEALNDGLNKIGLSKNQVRVEEIKEHKKTFFSILEPRVVKLKITELENLKSKNIEKIVREQKKPKINISSDEIEKAKLKAKTFIEGFLGILDIGLTFNILYENEILVVNINGEKAGLIIGYRGETIDAIQILLNSIVNKRKSESYIRIIVDAENYRKKREKTLKDLALKEASIAVSRGKSITLEPMVAFERKIIHEALQDHPRVISGSVGEEPYRKVIISLK